MAQKAKVNWLKFRDQNTRYFQTKATVRKKGNEIFKIKKDHGLRWFTGGGLEQVFVQDFKRRFSYAVKSIGALNAYGPMVTVLVCFMNAGILSKGQWAL